MDDPELPPDDAVEVAYGTVDRQWLVAVPWVPGLTARQALEQSGVLAHAPDVDPKSLVIGRYGRPIPEATPLDAGDRIELCRPLRKDPREMRRAAVAEGAVIGKASS
jgi:putative ubiquitin-RnfH superfamily antitoxin RatB of RatAB toxin-antitoxin module